MATFTMTKDKNIVYFQATDKVKPYMLDINTGIFYGVAGRPIITSPKGFSDFLFANRGINNICWALNRLYSMGYFKCMSEYKSLIQLADKLASIGYTITYNDGIKEINYVSDHFRDFAREFKNNPNLNIASFYSNQAKKNWIIEHSLDNIPHLDNEMINILWNHKDYFSNEHIHLVGYYMARGLYDFFCVEKQTIRFSNTDGLSTMFSTIKKYFNMCAELNVEPQTGDFFRNMVNIRRQYLITKENLDNEALIAQYKKHPSLTFENDTFTVVIPNSSDDFLKEANSQNNCVYSYYLKKVVNGTTNVVFVRRKDTPNKSYITCEVSNNGKVIQWLGFNNNRPTEKDAEIFLKAYMGHLHDTWENE